MSRVLFFPSSSSRASFSIARERPSFCSRYIFSSPLLVQLAVQGRNLLETSFLSTSSPLRLPFNLFLRPFLRLRFRSSRPSSSSCIFPSDLSSSCTRISSPYSSVSISLLAYISFLCQIFLYGFFHPPLSFSCFLIVSASSSSFTLREFVSSFSSIFDKQLTFFFQNLSDLFLLLFFFKNFASRFILFFFWTTLVLFSYSAFVCPFQSRLTYSCSLHSVFVLRRFLFQIPCLPGSAITSSYPLSEVVELEFPLVRVAANSFCTVHIQSL